MNWFRFEIMKITFFNYNNEKKFEIPIDVLDSVDDKYVLDDVLPMNEYDVEIFSNLSEEVFVIKPYDNGNDFYLQYLNHSDYYKPNDNNFKIGSLISHTFGRNDKEENFINLYREVYRTGKKNEGILKFLNKDGKLLKYVNYRIFKRRDNIITILDDKTEVRMYRDSILNNEKLGVAIIQDEKIVELNETYARSIHRTREDLLNTREEFKGIPPQAVQKVKNELESIQKQEKLSYKSPIIRYDDKGELLFYLNAEATYITYNNMPAVLVKIFDLTQQEKFKQFMESNPDKDKRIQSTLDDLVTHSKTFHSYGCYPDEFYVSDNFYDIIEDESRSYPYDINTVRNFIVSDDLRYFEAKLESITPNNTEVEFISRIMTLNFNIKYIRNHIQKVFDSDGNAIYLIASHQDVTDETNYSNSLKKEILEKNEVIKNKDIEIKEAHHNIKNNLNILLSLIRMEEHFNKDAAEIIKDTKTHIHAISVMHEKLYQSRTLVNIEIKDYVDSIVESLLDIYSSKIEYNSKVDDISINSKQAGTLGIMINEFVNNTVKYAFPDNNPGRIELKISRLDKLIEVEYYDSGVGLPDNVDFENPKTLGLIVIQNLTKQLNGKIQYFYDKGLHLNLEFEETDIF